MIVVASHLSVVLYVRAEPGEDLVEVLFDAVRNAELTSAAIVAVAGSAEYLRYGVVSIGDDCIPRYTNIVEEIGAIELTGMQGHVGREQDGTPTAHLHGSFALSDGTVVAGHVYQARALVTVELTLLGSTEAEWIRSQQIYGDGHTMPILVPVAGRAEHACWGAGGPVPGSARPA